MAAPAAKDRGKEVRSAAVEKSVNPVHDNVESTTSSELWKRHLSNASSEPRNITIHCNKHYAIIHYTLDTMSRVLYAVMSNSTINGEQNVTRHSTTHSNTDEVWIPWAWSHNCSQY